MFGPHPETTPSLHAHWENVYHIDDDVTKPSNARYSTYQSFLRQSLKLLYNEQADKSGGGECGIPKQAIVKEVHVLRERDVFKGLVVTLKDAMSDSFDPPKFEMLFGRTFYLERMGNTDDVMRRIQSIEVCAVTVCVRCLHSYYRFAGEHLLRADFKVVLCSFLELK